MSKTCPANRYLVHAAVIFATAATAAAATPQDKAGCAAIAMQIDQMNAQITSRGDALSGSIAMVMAGQAGHRQAIEKERNDTTKRALAGSLLGAVLPGADMVAGIAGPVTANQAPTTAPTARTELTDALAATADMGGLATRAGELMAAYQTMGCAAR